jgi:hypothetical protein
MDCFLFPRKKMSITVAASPSVETQRLFENLRARWAESQVRIPSFAPHLQVSHAFIRLEQTSTSPRDLATGLQDKVQLIKLFLIV